MKVKEFKNSITYKPYPSPGQKTQFPKDFSLGHSLNSLSRSRGIVAVVLKKVRSNLDLMQKANIYQTLGVVRKIQEKTVFFKGLSGFLPQPSLPHPDRALTKPENHFLPSQLGGIEA